jgi:5'-methylthioadenosine phosphorylase
MTAASEAVVMREAKIGYGCLAIVTNLAAGMSTEKLDHELDVLAEMDRSGQRAVEILLRAADLLVTAP